MKKTSHMSLFLLLGTVILHTTFAFGTESGFKSIKNPFSFEGAQTETAKETEKKQKAVLEMIYFQGEEKVAVISGNQYHVGDKIGETSIISITLDYVEFDTAGQKWKMYVKTSEN